MGTYPVVLKQLQGDQGIPSGVPFGKRMGLASQGIESIAESTIDPLNMDSGRFRDHLAEGGTDLDGEQFAMLIAMLDRLCQANVWRDHQRRTSGLARADRLTIGPCEDRRIAPPAIAAPVQGTALCTRDGERHRSLNEFVAEAPSGAGGNEAAGAILHEASRAFAGIRFVGSTVFLRTKAGGLTNFMVYWLLRISIPKRAAQMTRSDPFPLHLSIM